MILTVTLAVAALCVQSVDAFNPMGARHTLRTLSMSGEFTLGILGDLHLDPRSMEDHYQGREHFWNFL